MFFEITNPSGSSPRYSQRGYTRIGSESSGNGSKLQGSQFPERRVNLANVPDREVATVNAGNLRLFYDVTEALSVESEKTFSQSNTVTTLDFDKMGTPIGVFINDQDMQVFEQEVQLLYETDGIRAVLGGFLALDETEFQSNSALPAAFLGPGLPPTLILTAKQTLTKTDTNYAIFGEAEIDLLSGLSLIAGARYDRQKTDFRQITDIVPSDRAFSGLSTSSNTGRETSFDAFLPKIGLSYDVAESVTLSATAQRAYRAGGVSINRLTGISGDFDPEHTWTYEASLRSEWFDDRLTVNANAYFTQWRDQQITNQVTALTQNAGESRQF